MITISNGLSFIRAPLALLFLQDNQTLRLCAIILAMITDSIDGYFARRYSSASKFGAVFDPAMDKFFVYFVLTVFYLEGNIKVWEICAMISRDFFLCIFSVYLLITKKWRNYHPRSIKWGKISTALQFIVLIGLTLNFFFSWYIYTIFIVFGILSFLELFKTRESNPSYKKT
jgi:CDP-diacylglycerol--glycerol-3-phosphate 3-phosphatidyltransferase